MGVSITDSKCVQNISMLLPCTTLFGGDTKPKEILNYFTEVNVYVNHCTHIENRLDVLTNSVRAAPTVQAAGLFCSEICHPHGDFS